LETRNAELQEELSITKEKLKEVFQHKLDLYDDVINVNQGKILQLSSTGEDLLQSDLNIKEEEEIRLLKQKIHSLEVKLVEQTMKDKCVKKEDIQTVPEVEYYKEKYLKSQKDLEELSEILIRISHTILNSDIATLIGATNSTISQEMKEKIQIIEKNTRQTDQTMDSLMDKIRLYEDMLVAKQKIVSK
jgi:hypothetical protein